MALTKRGESLMVDWNFCTHSDFYHKFRLKTLAPLFASLLFSAFSLKTIAVFIPQLLI